MVCSANTSSMTTLQWQCLFGDFYRFVPLLVSPAAADHKGSPNAIGSRIRIGAKTFCKDTFRIRDHLMMRSIMEGARKTALVSRENSDRHSPSSCRSWGGRGALKVH